MSGREDACGELRAEGALDGLILSPEMDAVRLRGHASARRFYRLRAPSDVSAILVVYAPEDAADGIERYVRAADWFRRAGVRVPGVWQRGRRALVVEDGGDGLLEAAPLELRPRLYRQAMITIGRIQRYGRRTTGPNPGWALDGARLRAELEFAERHAVQGWLGAHDGAENRREMYDRLSALLERGPRALCHRDFHARNLLVASERLMVLDFQDAMMGPVFYDAASLLLDNYVEVPSPIVSASLALSARAWPHRRAPDQQLRIPDGPRGLGPAERQHFALTALQRTLKALGTFGYQVTVAGNPDYATYAPRTWHHARRLLLEVGWKRYLPALRAFDRLPA